MAVKAKSNGKKAAEPANRLQGVLESELPKADKVQITPLRQRVLHVTIRGTSPLMILRFSKKAENKMIETHKAGSQARSKRVREARNFEDDCEQAKYVSRDGWNGIPADAFRCALIESCRLVGFKMTMAKMGAFVEADGYDKFDGRPLIQIHSDEPPEMSIMPVRNASGVMDLRARPMWREWHCNLRIRFDLDMFSVQDIANLLVRAGAQNGIGEGRVNSKNSAGMGYGAFEVEFAKE